MTKERYQWFKSQGICPQCKKAHVENRVICEECQKRNTEVKRIQYRGKRENNLCVTCGRVPPEKGKSQCRECLDISARKKREERHMRKEMGICVACGKERAYDGETLCLSCKMHQRETESKKPKTEEQKQKQSIEDKEKYYNRKSLGVCVNCGKRPKQHGLLCERCYSTILRRKSRIQNDITRSERPNYNRCYICGKEGLMEGKRVCEECYQTRLKSISSIMYLTKEEKNAEKFVVGNHGYY